MVYGKIHPVVTHLKTDIIKPFHRRRIRTIMQYTCLCINICNILFPVCIKNLVSNSFIFSHVISQQKSLQRYQHVMLKVVRFVISKHILPGKQQVQWNGTHIANISKKVKTIKHLRNQKEFTCWIHIKHSTLYNCLYGLTSAILVLYW